MAGFPLAAIGAGIGQFFQNYEQQRQLQQRRQLVQQELLKQQQQQRAEQALGGLDLSGFGGGNQLGSLAGLANLGGGMPQASVSGPSTTPPSALSAPAADPYAGNPFYQNGRYMPERDTATGIGGEGDDMSIPLDGPAQSSKSSFDPNVWAAKTGREIGRDEHGNLVPIVSGKPNYNVAGFDYGRGPLTDNQARNQAVATAMENALKDPNVAAQLDRHGAADSSAGMTANLPNGQSIPVDKLLGGYHSFSDVAALIQKQRPDLDPQTRFLAAERLFKLVNQDNTQSRMFGLGVLRELGMITGLGIRQQNANTSAGRLADAQTRTQQAGTRIQQADRRLDQGDARLGQGADRLKQNQQRIDQAKTIADSNQRRQALQAELRNIQSQLNPGGLNPPPDDATKAELQRQQRDVINELRKISGMKPLPAPTPAPTEGGASADIPPPQ